MRNLRISSSSSIPQPHPLPEKRTSLRRFPKAIVSHLPNIRVCDAEINGTYHGIPLKIAYEVNHIAYDDWRSKNYLPSFGLLKLYPEQFPSLAWWSIWKLPHHPIEIPHFEKDPTILEKIRLGLAHPRTESNNPNSPLNAGRLVGLTNIHGELLKLLGFFLPNLINPSLPGVLLGVASWNWLRAHPTRWPSQLQVAIGVNKSTNAATNGNQYSYMWRIPKTNLHSFLTKSLAKMFWEMEKHIHKSKFPKLQIPVHLVLVTSASVKCEVTNSKKKRVELPTWTGKVKTPSIVDHPKSFYPYNCEILGL